MSDTDPIAASLTAVREARAAVEKQRDEGIERIRAAADERIDQLQRAEAALEPLATRNGDAPAAPKPSSRGKRGGGRRRRKDSTPRRSAPAPAPRGADRASTDTPTAAARESASDKAKANREAVLRFIRAHPGCQQRDVIEGAGIAAGSVAGVINALTRSRQGGGGQPLVRVEKPSPRKKLLFPREADVARSDDHGLKTGDERKVVTAIVKADGPIPATQISVRAGVRQDHVSSICQGLQRRGILTAVPPKRDGFPTRWKLTPGREALVDALTAAAS